MVRIVGLILIVLLVGGALSTRHAAARRTPRPQGKDARKLLHPATLSGVAPVLRPHVDKLLNRSSAPVSPDVIEPGKVYVRIAPEDRVWKDGGFVQGAALSGRPFQFVTCPETIYGRSVLEIYSAIGYAPRDILVGQKTVKQVAIVFSYDDEVKPFAGTNGVLDASWQRTIYPATWINLVALAHKMANEPDLVGFDPKKKDRTKLFFATKEQHRFFIGFSESGKKRVRETSYQALKVTQGPDWEYRQHLENLMGAFEPYTGNGTTEVTLGSGTGFPEFLGPNVELSKIRDIAIVRLGALTIPE